MVAALRELDVWSGKEISVMPGPGSVTGYEPCSKASKLCRGSGRSDAERAQWASIYYGGLGPTAPAVFLKDTPVVVVLDGLNEAKNAAEERMVDVYSSWCSCRLRAVVWWACCRIEFTRSMGLRVPEPATVVVCYFCLCCVTSLLKLSG